MNCFNPAITFLLARIPIFVAFALLTSECPVVTATHQPGSGWSFPHPANVDRESGPTHNRRIANELAAFDRSYDGRTWEQLIFVVVAPLLLFHCLSDEHA